MILQDVLKPNLDIVFCGTAVGTASAKKKAYYAGVGNQFYPILFKVGLTPKQLQPQEYPKLLDYNMGLTDMVKKVSGNDIVLTESDFDVLSFKNKIKQHQPKIVCFNGKKAAAVCLGTKTKNVAYGFLPQTIGTTKLFVAPSTSGSARRFWEEKYWYELENNI